MYAIVEIAGQQFKVSPDQKLFTHRLNDDEGNPQPEGVELTFDKVLLVDSDGAVVVGTPTVSGASVTATVERHVKGDKVIVFKKKRRKGYRKKNGHRQQFTQLKIETVNA